MRPKDEASEPLADTRSTRQSRAKARGTKRALGSVDRSELDAMLGFQLRLAYVAMSRHFATALSALDLTQKQTGVLCLIGVNPGVSQIELARELGMDRASMMAVVGRLEQRGIVMRERCATDGRRQELYLTSTGRHVMAQAKAALDAHERWACGRFSKAELAALMRALTAIHA